MIFGAICSKLKYNVCYCFRGFCIAQPRLIVKNKYEKCILY